MIKRKLKPRESRYRPMRRTLADSKFLAVLMVLSVLGWHLPLAYLDDDSSDFIKFSEFPSLYFGNADTLPSAFVVRAPGYPLLIALARTLAFGDLSAGVRGLHALFAVAAVLAVIAALRPAVPAVLTTLGVCFLLVT